MEDLIRLKPKVYYYLGRLNGIVYRVHAVSAYEAYHTLKRVRGHNLDDRSLNHLFNAFSLDRCKVFESRIRNLEIINE